MKKIIALLLAFVMVFALAACGSKDADDNNADADNNTPDTDANAGADDADANTDDDNTADDGENQTDDAKVMTHDEFIAAEVDTQVVVETYVQAKQGWWEKDGVGVATFYTQAEDGAYFLYNMPCSQEDYDKLVTGTKILVVGYKTEWCGEAEIIDATYKIIDGNYVAEALDVTDLLGTDELINHQNELVSFTNMTVEASKDAEGNEVAFLYNWDGSGSEGDDLYFNVSLNGTTYNFVVESYLTGVGTDVYEAVKTLNIGDTVSLEGFLYWYEGANPHIISVTVAG